MVRSHSKYDYFWFGCDLRLECQEIWKNKEGGGAETWNFEVESEKDKTIRTDGCLVSTC